MRSRPPLARPVRFAPFVAALAVAAPARADDIPKDLQPRPGDLAVKSPPPLEAYPTGEQGVRRELRYDLRLDVPIVIAGYLSWQTLEQLRPQLSPGRCRWCDRDLNTVDEGARSALRWGRGDHALARTFSDLGANVLTPTAAVGLTVLFSARDGKFGNAPLDVLFVAQATAFANAANLITKYSVGRARPYAREASLDPRGPGAGTDTSVSFYSGHTSYAFVIAVSSGTVASMRGYRNAGWVWAAGLTFATATAYLRVAADEHYLTDVLAGAVSGATFGFLFPYLLHRPVSFPVPLSPSVTPTAGGATLGMSGAF